MTNPQTFLFFFVIRVDIYEYATFMFLNNFQVVIYSRIFPLAKTHKALNGSNKNLISSLELLQNLSFARSGNEKQSKLVWSDGSGPSLKKRYREEA